MSPLEHRVLGNIRKQRMLLPGDRVGVAVSGGADSVALLRLLYKLRESLGITLLVVHFEHGLRGEESRADAAFVEDLAVAHQLEFILDCEDVAAAAAREKWNIEDAARRRRYAFFSRLVRQGKATRIAVAHTADDQAETVLAHLIRGTGPAGLAGIYPEIDGIVRPLLGERRGELRSYLRGCAQAWREDSTNLDLRRLRARVRARLLPLLENEFSPHMVDHLGKLARLAREDEAFWAAFVEDLFRECVRESEGSARIQIHDLLVPGRRVSAATIPNPAKADEFRAHLRALTERLIRRVYQHLNGSRQGLTARHVEQVIRLASESTSGCRINLPHAIVVARELDELVFFHQRRSPLSRADETHSPSRTYHYTVSLPARGTATICVPELSRRFCLKVIDWRGCERDTNMESLALDADRLRVPLVLRNARSGDAYRPRGRGQVQKLKQLFLAGRVPVRDRAGWPVLESGGFVVWVRGMPPADEFCIRKNTRTAVAVEEGPLYL